MRESSAEIRNDHAPGTDHFTDIKETSSEVFVGHTKMRKDTKRREKTRKDTKRREKTRKDAKRHKTTRKDAKRREKTRKVTRKVAKKEK